MKKIKYILLIGLYLLIGCTNKTGKNDNISCTIAVDENNLSEKILYSDLFDSLKYVSLKTSDEILIKQLTKVQYFNERIYVLDKQMQSVFSFDMAGELVWKIQKQGEGPGEYSQLVDFDIDAQANKLLLFSRLEKIQVYDLEGNFIEEQRTPLFGTSFATFNNWMYIYTGGRSNVLDEKNEQNNLLIRNAQQIWKGEIPFSNELGSVMIYELSNAFCKYENEIRFFMPFSSNIYSVKEDSVYIKYHFDFGKYNFPGNYFDNHTTDDLSETQYAFGLNSYWENKKYCYFQITYKQESVEIMYSKKDGKVYCGILYDNLGYCFPQIFQAAGNCIVGARYPEDLFMEYNYSPDARKNTILEKIISEIDENDNLVVFLYYFKS